MVPFAFGAASLIRRPVHRWCASLLFFFGIVASTDASFGAGAAAANSESIHAGESFASTMQRMTSARPGIMAAQRTFLAERYDLADRPAPGFTMTRGKAVQAGARARLSPGVTWALLAELTPAEIRARDIFPAGFRPLPHPQHAEGGMLFPSFAIAEV